MGDNVRLGLVAGGGGSVCLWRPPITDLACARSHREQYDIVMGDNVRLGLVVPRPDLVAEGDVHLHTVAGLVVVSISNRRSVSVSVTAAVYRYQ